MMNPGDADFHLLNIGSTPLEQGNYLAKAGRRRPFFAVLDLTMARIVNGADCGPSF
jgi:hypothetical protein